MAQNFAGKTLIMYLFAVPDKSSKKCGNLSHEVSHHIVFLFTTSHMYTHTHVPSPLPSFILMELKIKTRKILALGICFMITGLAIMGDWQGIGHDPCLAASSYNSSSFTNKTTTLSVHANASSTKNTQEWNTGSGSFELLDREVLQASHCEAQSFSGHDCYWNPVSQVTGKLCKDCDPVCRSVQKSLNFVQFALGVTLLTSTIPVATIVTSLVTTQFLPQELQVGTQCFVLQINILTATVLGTSLYWLD